MFSSWREDTGQSSSHDAQLAFKAKRNDSRSHFQRETYRLQAGDSNAKSLPDLVRDSCLYQAAFKKSHGNARQYYPHLNELRQVKKKKTNNKPKPNKALLKVTPMVSTPLTPLHMG